MPLTSNSDFYVAIHDAGINRIVRHVMRQRPSLFNYGTALLASNPELLCELVDVAPEVIIAGNPIITVLPPLPVVGTSYGLNYCVQLTRGEIDFHPGDVFALPTELTPPLPVQRLAFHFRVCAGIGCPSKDIVFPGLSHLFPRPNYTRSLAGPSRLETSNPRLTGQETAYSPGPSSIRVSSDNRGNLAARPDFGLGTFVPPERDITVLPTREIECFCLDLFATGGASISGAVGNQKIQPKVDGIEIVDLKPEGLENGIECYALVALNQGIIPPIGESISKVAFDVISLPDGMGTLQVSAATPPAVPNNPAIEDDQLKTFINLDKVSLNIPFPPPGGGGGGGGSVTRTTRARTRTGTFDLTAAISEGAFVKIFDAIVNGFRFSKSGSGSFGPLTASYNVSAHLEGGTIELTPGGAIKVSEVDIKWDTLHLDLGFDIPAVCTPGFCLVWIPIAGCQVYIDPACVFSDNPDISIPIDLSGLITSEVTFTAIPKVFYGVGSGVPNRWQITMVPTLPIDIDIIDIADTVGDLFHNLITAAIDNLMSGFPQWAKDLVDAILGGTEDVIRTVLDIPDDIGEWILDLIGNLGIWQDLVDALSEYIAITVFELEDPYPILPAAGGLIPVTLPIEFLDITVNTDEMVITGDVGN